MSATTAKQYGLRALLAIACASGILLVARWAVFAMDGAWTATAALVILLLAISPALIFIRSRRFDSLWPYLCGPLLAALVVLLVLAWFRAHRPPPFCPPPETAVEEVSAECVPGFHVPLFTLSDALFLPVASLAGLIFYWVTRGGRRRSTETKQSGVTQTAGRMIATTYVALNMLLIAAALALVIVAAASRLLGMYEPIDLRPPEIY